MGLELVKYFIKKKRGFTQENENFRSKGDQVKRRNEGSTQSCYSKEILPHVMWALTLEVEPNQIFSFEKEMKKKTNLLFQQRENNITASLAEPRKIHLWLSLLRDRSNGDFSIGNDREEKPTKRRRHKRIR